jgi:hypothetical protein
MTLCAAERLPVLIVLVALFAAPLARAEGPGTLVRGSVRVKERSLFAGLSEREDRSGVVVYLTGFAQPGEPEPATLSQRGERFEPKLLPIVAGQTVVFPTDRLYHNVFSVSPKLRSRQYRSTDAPRSVASRAPGWSRLQHPPPQSPTCGARELACRDRRGRRDRGAPGW